VRALLRIRDFQNYRKWFRLFFSVESYHALGGIWNYPMDERRFRENQFYKENPTRGFEYI
jgi:hypothetical protein